MPKTKLIFLLFVLVNFYGAIGENQDFGVKPNVRIIGGNVVANGAYPFMASLRDTANKHFCGGAIITHRTILTSASCIWGKTPPGTLAWVGTRNLDLTGARYQPSRLIIHPNYNPYTLLSNLGLVVVSSNITIGGNVQIIDLGLSNIEAGVNGTLIGWGETSYPGNLPTYLGRIHLETISVNDCISRWNSNGNVTDDNICTFTKQGEGACNGDLGGPLVVDNDIVGILSWIRPCARGYPDIFTRVSSHINWIQENQIN